MTHPEITAAIAAHNNQPAEMTNPPENTDQSNGQFNPHASPDADLMEKKINSPAFGQVLTAEQVAANQERRQAELDRQRRINEAIQDHNRILALEAKAAGRPAPTTTVIPDWIR